MLTRHRSTSQFVLIKYAAEHEDWVVAYLDQGVGRDTHVFMHKKRRQVLEVAYLNSRPVRATWCGDRVGLDKIVDILIGVDVPRTRALSR